jgi:hypothetical protein
MEDPEEEPLADASVLKTKTGDARGPDVPACMGLPTGRIAQHLGRDGLVAGSSRYGARRRTRIVLRDKVAGLYSGSSDCTRL